MRIDTNRCRRRPQRLLLLIALLSISSCDNTDYKGGSNTAMPPSSGGRIDTPLIGSNSADVRREFEAIAQRLMGGSNQYLGHAQYVRINKLLQAPNIPVRDRIGMLVSRSIHALRLGKNEQAVTDIDNACQLLQQSGAKPPLQILRLRAVSYLRLAEYRNCIGQHNRDCCIFPLRRGGVHQVQAPAREAKRTLLQLLGREPNNLTLQWLLNIACMALSEYPDQVPAEFRIPELATTSEDEIGRFIDIAPQLGVDTFNLCGGVIVEDFDHDGLLDIVTSTFDPVGPLTFYRNRGDGRFDDRSTESGAASQLGGLNCIGGDYDNDGDTDVLILRGAWLGDAGRIRNSLLRNNGDGSFTDVTREVGLADPARPSQTAAWGDFDLDGDLDLYVGNESRVAYGDSSGDYPCQLFINNGEGKFRDVAALAGVTNDRFCKGVAIGDFDNDGDPDLYVSNVGPNRLYRNNGDAIFTDVAAELGVSEPADRSFACWFFDYDNDGWLDLFVAGYKATPGDLLADLRGQPHDAILPCLYRNQGDGSFENVAFQLGLAHPYLPMGANFGDINNDGFLDIYLATGDPDFYTLMPNVMLRNDKGQRFLNVTFGGGLGHLQKGHGVAFADLDHDGDQDIYNQLGGFYPGDAFHNALFINPGHGNNFLVVQLQGVTSVRTAVGARISVTIQTPSGQRTVHRAVGCVSSFGGSPLRQEIGLGDATSIQVLEVYWPMSKTTQRFEHIAMNQMIRIRELDDHYEFVPRNSIEWDTSSSPSLR